MAESTATIPLMMLMMTPATALMHVMMQSPMPWKQDITAPIFAVLCGVFWEGIDKWVVLVVSKFGWYVNLLVGGKTLDVLMNCRSLEHDLSRWWCSL